MSKNVYVIFGAGKAGRNLARTLPAKVAYFVDNAPGKWGESAEGIRINNPQQLLTEDKDRLRIFIASMYFDQIQTQLSAMGFENNKHFFNIVPYYPLLHSKSFLSLIESRATGADDWPEPTDLVARLGLIGKIQQELVRQHEEDRILIAIAPGVQTALITEVQSWLAEFFKLKYLTVKVDVAADDQTLADLAAKYKRLGYSRLLYLGLARSGCMKFCKYFDYYRIIDKGWQSADSQSRIDDVYKMVNGLGFNYKKVSVIIPNYNYEQYLGKRIRSIFGQHYPIYEIVFIDDASNDDSIALATDMLEEYRGKKYVSRNDKNSGSVFAQWKKGLEAVSGNFVWIAEADDFASPLMLAQLMPPFDDEEVVMSFCDSMLIDGNQSWGGFCSDALLANMPAASAADLGDGIYEGQAFIDKYLAMQNSIQNASAVVFRRTAIKQEYLQSLEQFRRCGDWYFYLLLLSVGKVAYSTMPMNYFRRHSRAVTTNTTTDSCANEAVLVAQLIERLTRSGRRS